MKTDDSPQNGDGEDPRRNLEQSTTNPEGLPVSLSLGPSLEAADMPVQAMPVDRRVIYISFLAIIVGIFSGLLAQALIFTIRLITNLSFRGQFSFAGINYPLTHPQLWVIAIPVIGAFFIGLLARYGSRAVAGHGIPEAMEQVLSNQSRIPPKLTFLKPFSAAISIGTGAPYGAEGPIIASGGAIGSLLGQLLKTTAEERKILLSAGAAAGLACAFNAPISSILLAVELLLFEFRPRSLIPVGLACGVAAVMHVTFEGSQPFFSFGNNALHFPSQLELALYLGMGCIVGVASVVLTQTVHLIEHIFEHLPVHWMWHPAIGAIAVGVIGYFVPQTFGSGYYNIDHLLENNLPITVIAIIGVAKFVSWTVSLGSGTAGGTLAPVFTIGGALGAVLGVIANRLVPSAHINIGLAALAGMVGIFAGASRALLTSVAFAVESTMQAKGILPALAECCTAYLVSSLLMRYSIMTAKMVRQGIRVPEEYAPDFLSQLSVEQVMTPDPVTLRAEDSLETVRAWMASNAKGSTHQGFPVLDDAGVLVGVLTRRNLLHAESSPSHKISELITRPPKFIYDDCSLRDAADHMISHDIGRLPVVARETSQLIGILTRSDLLRAQRRRIKASHDAQATIRLRLPSLRRRRNGTRERVTGPTHKV